MNPIAASDINPAPTRRLEESKWSSRESAEVVVAMLLDLPVVS
jgi:hypothetical protein